MNFWKYLPRHAISLSSRQEFLLHMFVLVATGVILLYGSSITTKVDMMLYRCYANIFLHTGYYVHCPADADVTRLLPKEYPILSLIPMLLGLLGGNELYGVTFMLLMFGVIAATYLFLYYKASRGSAFAFLLYTIAGGFGVAVSRLDVIVGLLLLLILYLTRKGKFTAAYVLLAFATMFKLIPALLVLPVFLSEQLQTKEKSIARFHGLCLYLIVTLVLFAVSLLLDTQSTLSPFIYHAQRPMEVEAISASVLVGLSYLHIINFCFSSGFGSLNIYGFLHKQCLVPDGYPLFNSLVQLVSIMTVVFFLVGLGWMTRLFVKKQWTLSEYYVGLLLLFLLTGKVFSLQYLLWVFPIIAYLYGFQKRWVIPVVLVGIFTTLIYPFFFSQTIFTSPITWVHPLANVIFIRNVLFVLVSLAFFGNLFRMRTRLEKHI